MCIRGVKIGQKNALKGCFLKKTTVTVVVSFQLCAFQRAAPTGRADLSGVDRIGPPLLSRSGEFSGRRVL